MAGLEVFHMAVFPYPVRSFACRTYDAPVWEKMLRLDEAFYHPLCMYAGGVAGETGIPGLKLDFRAGLRLEVPKGAFHVRISDGETGDVFFDDDVSETLLVSMEKYHRPWRVAVWQDGQMVFAHDFDIAGQAVHIAFLTQSLGDVLAAMPSVAEFVETRRAQVTLAVPEYLEALVHFLFPQIPLVQQVPQDAYAAFYIGNGNGEPHQLPVDGRSTPLELIPRIILGLEGAPPAPPEAIRARLLAGPRPVREPYVCISVQASSAMKGWLFPHGWDEVIEALRGMGYRVLCIDQEREQSDHGLTVRMPEGAEDFTGSRPLVERAQFLAHAAFFIGLGSGLSWLAWMAGCPVVMIAGFSSPWYEFPEAERVWNPRVCHGCFNVTDTSFLMTPCPRFGEQSPQYMECQRKIPPQMVLRAVGRIRAALGEG